jgi:type II secretory pathway pseudopilin PulG
MTNNGWNNNNNDFDDYRAHGDDYSNNRLLQQRNDEMNRMQWSNSGRASPSVMDYPTSPNMPDVLNNNDRLLIQLQSRQRQLLLQQQEQLLLLREQMMRQQQQQQHQQHQQHIHQQQERTSYPYTPVNHNISVAIPSTPTTPTSPARRVMTPLHDKSQDAIPVIRSPLLEEFRSNKNKKFGLKVKINNKRRILWETYIIYN